ncbi:hypothetical protein CCY99_06235 [Helicobacter sp. 16-1353]|nr:hypothetical protein CCY99_06235 [Helicobacter sp. 16-1353]
MRVQKSRKKGSRSTSRSIFAKQGKCEALPLFVKKAELFWRKGSGDGLKPFLREKELRRSVNEEMDSLKKIVFKESRFRLN